MKWFGAQIYVFTYKNNQPPDVHAIVKRANGLSNNKWRRDGVWMAVLHFTSALLRLTTVSLETLSPDEAQGWFRSYIALSTKK